MAAMVIAVFFAMNIGGSGSASSMAAAFGGGVLSKRAALGLTALFAFLGAAVASQAVIKTVSGGIVPRDLFSVDASIAVLIAASICIFVANLMRVPLSTSQATVGAVTGVGLYLGTVNVKPLEVMVVVWISMVFLAFGLVYALDRFLYTRILHWLVDLGSAARVERLLKTLTIASSCYVAFSIGANNTGNAIGPLVGASLVDPTLGAVIGGLFIALGAFVLGGGVLYRAGKEITKLCLIRAIFISFSAGTLIIVSSLAGIPVSLAQFTTAGIIGAGCAQDGSKTLKNAAVKSITRTWAVSPLASMALSFGLLALIRR